ncbi:hypothetical protein TUM12151_31840 [Morganella morganii]|nr:hypothetical protein TUM12149_26040 [Morganella morganii]GIZ32539.1 hypothetical protein TUM12150_30250 [Morganella morganii]GIZ36198.1 hypothetical protein TUM12151_31840 [Morganella morganii]
MKIINKWNEDTALIFRNGRLVSVIVSFSDKKVMANLSVIRLKKKQTTLAVVVLISVNLVIMKKYVSSKIKTN